MKAQGHFVNNFKVGAGLVVNIQKGTNFSMEQQKVNNEVWLPAMMEGNGAVRVFCFFTSMGVFGRWSRTIGSSRRRRRFCRG